MLELVFSSRAHFLQLKSSGKHFSKSPKGVEFAVEGTRPAIAATIPSPIRGGVAGSVLAMHRLLLYALAAMNGGPFSSDPVVQEDYISPLPDALRCSLMAVHASGRSKHSASPWRPEMDAYVLLRHVRDKISLPKVAQQWPFPPPAKKSRAVQLRWHNVLKGLAGIDELSLLMCGRCEEQEMSETQLKSTEASLQPWVEDALCSCTREKPSP